MLSAAVAYVRTLNVSVFPVAADCRTPIRAEGWFEHGVHDATADPLEAERRWKAYPDAQIALACGPASGVFVLDVDVKGDDGFVTLAALEKAHGALPATWRSKTPSGGAHLFFRQPERVLRNRVGFAPGLDIRTKGGSVALPPSRKPNGAYTWVDHPKAVALAEAPTWLLDLIDPPPPPRKNVKPLRMTDLDRTVRYVVAAVEGECQAVASTKANTGRNLRLFQAGANLGELVGAGLLPQDHAEDALERAAYDCGLVQEDGMHAVRATIASGLRKGLANPREVRSA